MMKHLKKIIFNSMVILSLLLSFAVAMLCADGRHTGYILYWIRAKSEIQFCTSRGSFWIYRSVEPGFSQLPRFTLQHYDTENYALATDFRNWGYGPKNIPYHFDFAGFVVGSGSYSAFPNRKVQLLVIPGWGLLLITLMLPAAWCWSGWKKYHIQRRIRAGYCAKCGYDLRATPDRCPECGLVVTSK